MTYIPIFAPTLLFFIPLAFIGAWDGLVRRHVRFTFQLRGIDLHIRGVPAIGIGLVSLGVLYIVLRFGVDQFRLVSQICAGAWGCVTQITWQSFTSSSAGFICALIAVLLFLLWALSIREMQGPYQILPVASGVVFSEGDIVRRVQEKLRKAKLDPVSSDIIVRAVCEIRWRGGTFGLYKTRDLGTSPVQYRRSLLRILGRLDIDALAKLSPRQRSIVIRETVDYIRDFRIRGIKAYPWGRKWLAQTSLGTEDATLPETDG